MKYYELLYRENDKCQWKLYNAYDTLVEVQEAGNFFAQRGWGQWCINENIFNEEAPIQVPPIITPLERIEKRIKRIDLLILSVLFVVIFAIVYTLTQLL